MDTIKTIKCYLCEKDIKVGFVSEQGGAIVENHPFYEMYLVHKDLSVQYFEEYKGADGINSMHIVPICEECFKKLLNKDVIKEKYQLAHDLYCAYMKINKMIGEENQNEPKSNN